MKGKRSRRTTAVRGSARQGSPTRRVFIASVLGVMLTLGTGLTVLLIGTAVALYSDDPSAFVAPIGHVALYAVGVIGGVVCPLLSRGSAFLVCGVGAFLEVGIFSLASLALPASLTSGASAVARFLMVLGYFAAAFLGCALARGRGRR